MNLVNIVEKNYENPRKNPRVNSEKKLGKNSRQNAGKNPGKNLAAIPADILDAIYGIILREFEEKYLGASKKNS